MRSFLILVVALALAAVLFLALRSSDASVDALHAQEERARVDEPVLEEAAPEPAGPEPARAAVREAEPAAPIATPKTSAAPQDEDTRAAVRGRFVLPGGVPAVGAAVELHGWGANSERLMEHGRPESWQDPQTTTGGDGSFELRFDPPRAFQFTLDAKLPGYAAASWRWSELLPGSVTDLGTVELAATGSLRVRMVDAQGEPIRAGWTIYADSAAVAGAAREPTRVMGGLDPSTASALLEDLPAGATKLKAYSRISGWVDGPTVEVEVGREKEATIRYEGPDESRRLVVVVFTGLFHTLRVKPESVRLSGGGLEPRSSHELPSASQSYVFEDLPSASYTVEIDDPRFEPWSRSGLEPGTSVNAKLRGSAGLRVSVVGAAGGESVTCYDLRLRLEGTNSWPSVFQLLAPRDEPPANGLFEGIPPVPATLLVAAEGYTELELPLEGLAPGEVRSVVAELQRGASLTGRVTTSDGATPVPGAQVQVAPAGTPARIARRGAVIFGDDERARVVHAETDADGRFELAAAPAGTWTLRAIANPWLVTSVEEFEIANGDSREVALSLPPASSLRGRLVAPEGQRLGALRLTLQPSAAPIVDELFGDDRLAIELASDGTFASAPLPPGSATLWLAGPEVSLPRGFNASSTANVPELELARVELEADASTELELDLRARWFGSIRARVTRKGQPLAGYLVEVQHAAGPTGRHTSGALTGGDGDATVAHLSPGEWIVRVRPLEGTWKIEALAPIEVVSGRESSCTIEVAVAAGSVRIVDRATGEPLRSTALTLSDSTGRGRGLRTDAEGRLELELAAGSYVLSAGTFWTRGPEVTLEWTAAGPAAEAIELELPPEDG